MAPGPQPPGKDCLVVAAAGYGKSSWLSSLAADAGGRYCTAAELAADDCAAVGELPSRLGLLAVDDLTLAGRRRRDRAGACAGRTGLAGSPWSWPDGACSPRSPGRSCAGLRWSSGLPRPRPTPEANARVLREEHGITDVDVADQVHQLTGGRVYAGAP